MYGTRHHRVWWLNQPRTPVRVYSAAEVLSHAASRSKDHLLHARLGHPGKSRSARYKALVRGLGKK